MHQARPLAGAETKGFGVLPMKRSPQPGSTDSQSRSRRMLLQVDYPDIFRGEVGAEELAADACKAGRAVCRQ